MAFSRLARNLVRDPQIGRRVVPIIPDEARTFGMDPLFKEVGIYNPLGQRYTPVDKELLLSYLEKADGQLLEEGITEAGSMSSFQAAGTSYATWSEPMVPFYTFYSMFGLQRTGDQVWAFGDARGRGFMMGATAGRTTLTGEGLQHDDGQSHLLASTIPNVLAYDPAFAYELAIIVREGIDRMYGERGEDVFYYITIYNENWVQPAKAEGVEEGVLRGLYKFRAAPSGSRPRPAARLRARPSSRRSARSRSSPRSTTSPPTSGRPPRSSSSATTPSTSSAGTGSTPTRSSASPYVRECIGPSQGPIVAATDYLKAVPDMVARWIDRPYTVLGTDGFGRSDTREALRTHFEVNAEHIAYAALHGLCLDGASTPDELKRAIAELGIDPERVNPLHA